MAIVRNLIVRGGADFSGMRRGMQQASSQLNNFHRTLSGTVKRIALTLATLGAGFTIKEATQDAAKFEAMMGTLGATLGDSIKDFEQWQDTVGRSLGYSKLQSADLANTLSLNFKGIATSQKDLMDKTTKMMETAAVIASKRGMAMTEVSDRIRSAMNQEADGADELGVNVRVSAIQQSKAYKEMANGKPWADLSTNMQKAILYHHILESVSTNLGDTLQNNTAMKMSVFTATLNDTRLALGQAFLPILNVALPVLTAFMRKIEAALQYVAAFSRALFGGGKVDNGQAKSTLQQANATSKQASAVTGLGNALKKTGAAAKQAAKDSKGSVAGFDEVNTLADSSSSTGGGSGTSSSGGSGDVSTPLDVLPNAPDQENKVSKISKNIKEFADKVKAFLAPIGSFFKSIWDVISDYFKEKVSGITKFWQEHGAIFIQAMQNIWSFLKPIILIIVSFIWDSIKGAIDGVIRFFEGLIEFIGGIFTGNWKEAFKGLKDMVIGFIQAAWNIFNLIFIVEIGGALKALVVSGGKLFMELFNLFKKPLGDVVTWAVKAFSDLVKSFRSFFSDFGTWFEANAVSIGHKFMAVFEGIGNAGKLAWSVIKGAFTGAYDWYMRTLINPLVNAFDNITTGFHKGFTSGLKAVANSVIDLINDAIDGMNKAIHIVPGTSKISIPHIPKLAKGGITNGPMLAMIGDNPGGQEVVSPLDKLSGIVTNAMLSAIQFNKPSASNIGGDIILNIDGRTFARIIKPYSDIENKRVGTNVRLQSI